MFYGNFYMSAEILGIWGFLIYCVALGCIAYGMIPYRRLCALEQNPHLCILTDDDLVSFYFKGKPALAIPLSAIKTLEYSKTSTNYGILFSLKSNAHSPVHIRGKFGQLILPQIFKDPYFFFPFFSEYSFKLLKQELQEYQDASFLS